MNINNEPQSEDRVFARWGRNATGRQPEIKNAARRNRWPILVILAALVLFMGCSAPAQTNTPHRPGAPTPQQKEALRRHLEEARNLLAREALERQRVVSIETGKRWVKLRGVIRAAQRGRKVNL